MSVSPVFLGNCKWKSIDGYLHYNLHFPEIKWKWNICIPPLPDFVDFYTHLTYICICTFFVLPLSVQNIFHHIFLSNCWWQKSDIWSQASYRYTILWVAFLDPSDSYFLFADLVGFYTHWTYICICTFFVAFF